MKKIGFIGAGKMAQAIIFGLSDKSALMISGRNQQKNQETALKLGVAAAASNSELAQACDLIVLSVKPQTVSLVLSEISASLTTEKTLISIAAGLDLQSLSDMTAPNQPIVRVMPNVNAAIQQSTSAIVRNEQVSDSNYQLIKSLFEQVGSIHEIAEKDFSCFSALSGSSPAFIYMFIDAMARAGVRYGLSKELATRISAETLAASAQNVLKSGEHPQALADSVASPAGTTIEGIVALENHNFNAAVISAIEATIKKEESLS
ncbi:MAG: pyrroline-5-carboxylate reductase [Streptococcaceae bacterium]|jgi:pyrroline-5-carboxylate reductase|nr:pyrroline-5-carboxylate reductase [Streptococcaceae bacterium]